MRPFRIGYERFQTVLADEQRFVATAFATHKAHTAFLTGAASAVGTGISMAFSEGLSDNGELTGRGAPLSRGLVTGLMVREKKWQRVEKAARNVSRIAEHRGGTVAWRISLWSSIAFAVGTAVAF